MSGGTSGPDPAGADVPPTRQTARSGSCTAAAASAASSVTSSSSGSGGAPSLSIWNPVTGLLSPPPTAASVSQMDECSPAITAAETSFAATAVSSSSPSASRPGSHSNSKADLVILSAQKALSPRLGTTGTGRRTLSRSGSGSAAPEPTSSPSVALQASSSSSDLFSSSSSQRSYAIFQYKAAKAVAAVEVIKLAQEAEELRSQLLPLQWQINQCEEDKAVAVAEKEEAIMRKDDADNLVRRVQQELLLEKETTVHLNERLWELNRDLHIAEERRVQEREALRAQMAREVEVRQGQWKDTHRGLSQEMLMLEKDVHYYRGEQEKWMNRSQNLEAECRRLDAQLARTVGQVKSGQVEADLLNRSNEFMLQTVEQATAAAKDTHRRLLEALEDVQDAKGDMVQELAMLRTLRQQLVINASTASEAASPSSVALQVTDVQLRVQAVDLYLREQEAKLKIFEAKQIQSRCQSEIALAKHTADKGKVDKTQLTMLRQKVDLQDQQVLALKRENAALRAVLDGGYKVK